MTFSLNICKTSRLDEVLRERLPALILDESCSKNAGGGLEISNSKIRRLIIAGCVFVDEKRITRPAFCVLKNSIIKVEFDKEKFFFEKQADDIKYEVSSSDILFEDEYLIIVNKKAFFPVEATIVGSEKRDNLHNAIVRYLWQKNPNAKNPPYVGIMHRLDRQTSGAILFTKTRTVNTAIHNMFENREVKKVYKVLCCAKTETKSRGRGSKTQVESQGRSKILVESRRHRSKILVESRAKQNSKIQTESREQWRPKIQVESRSPKNDFVVEEYTGRISLKSSPCKWGKVSKSSGGEYSKTHFRLLKKINFEGNSCFLLEAELFTGRTHQIRVHLSDIGFPVVGDELYGGIDASRIMLHSERLEFLHPVTGEKIVVRAECEF